MLSKELQTILANPRYFLITGFFLFLMATTLLIIWPGQNPDAVVKAQVSIQFFQIITSGLFLLVTIIIPIFCSPLVTSEREQHTLEILFITPLSSTQILFAKVFAAILYLFILLLLSFPIVQLCIMLGGVELSKVWDTYFFIFLWIIIFSQISILYSCLFSKSYAALAVSYITILPILAIVLTQFLQNYDTSLHYFSALFFFLPIFSILLWLCYKKFSNLHPNQRNISNEPKLMQKFITLHESEKEEKFFIIEEPQKQKNLDLSVKIPEETVFQKCHDYIFPKMIEKNLPDDINPIYAKEIYYEFSAVETSVLRAFLICLTLASIPMIFFLFAKSHQIYYFFMNFAIMLIIPALASSRFTYEQEIGMLDILKTTPLSFFTIYWGKAKAVLRLATIIFLFLSLLPTIALLSGKITLFIFIKNLFLSASLILFLTLFSLFISSLQHSTIQSLTISYSCIFILFIMPVIFLLLLQIFPHFSLEKWELLASLSPLSSCIWEISASLTVGWYTLGTLIIFIITLKKN